MRFRPWTIAFLVYQAVFLNIVLPGHTRGVVPLAGSSRALSVCDLGCPLCCKPTHLHDRSGPAAPKDPGNCALCYMAARLVPAPPVLLAPPRPILVKVLPPPTPVQVDPQTPALAYDGRAPPAATLRSLILF